MAEVSIHGLTYVVVQIGGLTMRCTLECCEDSWASGMAYAIVDKARDLEVAASVIGHGLTETEFGTPPTQHRRSSSNYPTSIRRVVAKQRWWALGLLYRTADCSPAIAWPATQMTVVEQHALR
jgi:hypothetical protein